ncbi:alcohol dehydrogenase, putative [Talaromyces stipitatus ATCC 10500]|uniref:Alcohol dehydrogenase, putative n=1 Tax=Talaromyces stipitatus (strain ATCC 10500 / CBS 375.48 / QM 6759 / NRRL 1006) TaxID=441959 RepID=B8LXC3_TALSN|nr:alcohol dehydrogenase, putative [Talaromyces stipitatus ATCC 10500]EED23204.1 alcohol dehydrogenase, putative [Talaromyces stipitatus ATCC 10500]
MATNEAAYLLEPHQIPLQIRDAPCPSSVEPNTIVVKNHTAYNPFPLKYPFILGQDVAGEVVDVGQGVEGFVKGQRVIGLSEVHTILSANMAAPIPSSVSYEEAVVLPLAVSTAAAGLFQKGFLELPLPTTSPQPLGNTLIVWSGSSSVGLAAIQLARAAGADVVATSSSRTHYLVKSIGASAVFDYTKPTVVDDIVAHLSGKVVLDAYDAISSQQTPRALAEILTKVNSEKHFMAFTGQVEKELPTGVTGKAVFNNIIYDNVLHIFRIKYP